MTDAVDTDRADKDDMQPGNNDRQAAAVPAQKAGVTADPADDRAGNHSSNDPGDYPAATENRGSKKPAPEKTARENLERVGVDAEHKTEAMRKHQRGTFP